MEKTKAHLVAVYEAATALPALAEGIFSAPVNADFNIPFKDIISTSFGAGVAGTTQRDDVTVAAPTVGDVLVITLMRVDSRQNERKTFRHYVVTGDTATSIALAFIDQINAQSSYTAVTGGAGVVQIEIDAQTFTTTVSTGLSVVAGVAFVQAVGLAADIAEDGGVALGSVYDVWEIRHYIDVPSSTMGKTSERSEVISRIYSLDSILATFNPAIDGIEDILKGGLADATQYHRSGLGTVS